MPTRKKSARRARYSSAASQPIATPKKQPKSGAERNAAWRARKAKQGKVEITGYISRRAREYLDALAREKQTGLFVALEEVILSAADRKEKTQKRSTERDEAATWLREVLADGPMPARDVRRQADEAGHSWRTVRRAQSAIGVQVSRDGFGRGGRWRWSLDHTDQSDDHRCPSTYIDVHPDRVDIYADNGHLRGDRE